MLFNSSVFLIFLLLVFTIYWKVAPVKPVAGRAILLISSYVFYGWWDWRFLILIAFSSGSDFLIGKYLYKTENSLLRKWLLLLSIFQNIGILFVFKYFNFFIDSLQSITGQSLPGGWSSLHIILPVGISFYTFQTLSYTLDIYFRKLAPTRSVLTFFTFVSFFPQLVAGPIERAANLLPQFGRQPRFSYETATAGLKLMLWGFFKKMVIADQLAIWVNSVYGQPDGYSGLMVLLATFAFGYQIYCDFSGYSDIAIGTAMLFGIRLMTNFRTPYFALSIRDFWQRWHISLSTWFRDYLYIPLGGSRVSKARWLRNVLVTFTVSGLWHGAAITFVLWGLFHGVMYAVEKLVSPLLRMPQKIKRFSGWILTFFSVNLAWMLFRAENREHLGLLAQRVFLWKSPVVSEWQELFVTGGVLNATSWMMIIAFPLFLLVEYFLRKMSFDRLFSGSPAFIRWGFYYLLLMMILFLGVLNSAPEFIYFQF
jgi:D-alanyl-lipoteichoic acid acyltransferase DltB (MBOAT superfamily)